MDENRHCEKSPTDSSECSSSDVFVTRSRSLSRTSNTSRLSAKLKQPEPIMSNLLLIAPGPLIPRPSICKLLASRHRRVWALLPSNDIFVSSFLGRLQCRNRATATTAPLPKNRNRKCNPGVGGGILGLINTGSYIYIYIHICTNMCYCSETTYELVDARGMSSSSDLPVYFFSI